MFFFCYLSVFPCFLPSIFAVPMREWLGEHSCVSSSFPIAVLGGALRRMLGFRIFQRLCSWSFMYEFNHFTIWSTDESLFDIFFNAYSLNVCVTYMCSDKSIVLFIVCEFSCYSVTGTIVYKLHIFNNCVFNFLYDFCHFDQLMILCLIFPAMCILSRVWIASCAVDGMFLSYVCSFGFLILFLYCFFLLVCCSHERVFGGALVHGFRIEYSLLLSDGVAAGVQGEIRCEMTISQSIRNPVSSELMMKNRLLTVPVLLLLWSCAGALMGTSAWVLLFQQLWRL